MRNETREHILNKLRKASQVTQGGSSTPDTPGELKLQWDMGQGLTEQLTETLDALNVINRSVSSDDQLKEFLKKIVRENAVKCCVAWEHPFLDKLRVPQTFKDMGVQYKDSFKDEHEFRQYCARADLGITSAHAIIEESGTIVVRAKRGWERATSLLPPVHLVILGPGKVVPSVRHLPSLLRSFHEISEKLPSAVHLITGPSRTADIEFNLVLGVHGPRKVYLLVALENTKRPPQP